MRPALRTIRSAGTIAREDLREQVTRVLLVDDRRLVRSGLHRLLERAGFEVAGEASCGEDAAEAAAVLQPDLALVDHALPDVAGVVRAVSERARRMRILVLTSSSAEGDVAAVVTAGACAYLLQSASGDEVVAAARVAAGSDSIIVPRTTARLFERLEESRRLASGLSSREMEILRMLASGRGNGEIARDLVISPSTVKRHVSQILRKLEAENRIQAATLAAQGGLL